MQQERSYSGEQKAAVGLKAYSRIVVAWALSATEAAALLNVSAEDWDRIQQGSFKDELSEEQLLRISATVGIYKALETYFEEPLSRSWLTRPNDAPFFNGNRPFDTAIKGGLPQLIEIRWYLDAVAQGM
ncbi:hypothetical protein GCM10011385_41150 [Nitratireductor aestuarii]|uniref:Antitoxin Xre/MbcA/ParS-like toxin-binding domain-containing protein n=1 Tax=Nitratireductor aestuarii TaxID=1735103 RepID=A0A916WBE5_9HYPH|nr:antitoxin Xre/MbcA/ParS toxin-binding domain-containing protein [Nitratireductor aestuarii]GGA82680.1 hypothetical protein GCM10011385_41150 [Nitratireductor aestuarii]